MLVTPAWTVFAAEVPAIKEGAPDRYVIQRGDTLWGIAGRYLKEPWRWPELWKMNQEQLKNPHLLYPGDALVLDRSGPEARLQLVKLDTVRLEPRVRAETSTRAALPSIPPSVIEPFLSKPLVVSANELDSAARIVATSESRVTIGAGDRAFARGITRDQGDVWQIFRRGDPLIDPETREVLGFEATYLGDARVMRHGEVAEISIIRSSQEIYRDDRLVPLGKQLPVFAYMPHPPQVPVKGRIISAYGSLQETGPLSIVALSKGSRDGLQVGSVLAIERSQTDARYSQRTEPLFGRSGITGRDTPRTYFAETLPPRDQLVSRGEAVTRKDIARLPDDRYGLLMVFRTFDRTSFALVMEAIRPVAVSDIVTNP
ncbi:MAG: LysM peptidoglycan-binding domain-containing protein [Betaproteobacteria bacterium]|nr:LysM peptidoglycan-binding domain-containing protein [Betaproteobacteria bacterium]